MINHRLWLRIASIVQFITAAIHTTSLFAQPQPANETERQLVDLMTNYKMDMGVGIHRSVSELTIGLSACFSLICLFGAILNWYLLSRQISEGLMKGMLHINLFIFGICFILMTVYTFLPPIILTGLIFVFLVVSRLGLIRKPANE